MNSPPGQSTIRGFTLIELLVVIGIVALLAGLLLPALAASREASRQSVCASNVRQFMIANDLYASDFGDAYAPGMPDRLANLTRWYGSRPSASAAFGSEGGPLSEYLGRGGGAALRSCPTFSPVAAILAAGAPSASNGFERGCGGYGYNTAFVGALRAHAGSGEWALVSDRTGMPRSRFADPARTIAFADAALRDASSAAGVIEYSFLEPRFWPEFPGERPDPSIQFRHGRGRAGAAGRAANIAWLDGHVGPEAMRFSRGSGFYPGLPEEEFIGWPGGADDNGLFDPD